MIQPAFLKNGKNLIRACHLSTLVIKQPRGEMRCICLSMKAVEICCFVFLRKKSALFSQHISQHLTILVNEKKHMGLLFYTQQK